jgi:hypothetical protein
MPLAMGRVMNTMRMFVLLLITLLTVGLLVLPVAKATPPVALQRFPSVGTISLEPGGNMTFSWVLHRDVSEFLFYYDVTGDVLDIYIDDAPVPGGQSLTGKGWRFCDGCEFSAGTYDVMALAPLEATQFYIVFYLMPLPPVEFAGFIPADSTEAFSEFGVIFPPSSANYTLVLGATGGSYDFFVDDTLEATVPETTTLSLDLGGDFHRFAADASGAGADVTWTVQIQGPPKLDVAIVNPESGGCDVSLNPESGQSVCVAGAIATPSDGGTPTITYQWAASGGELNSTNSQWVEWTAPPGVARFALTVEASAPGYVSGSDSFIVQVTPEFPSFVAPLLLMLALGFAAIAQRRSRNPVA